MRLNELSLDEKRMGKRDVSRSPIRDLTVGFEFEIATLDAGSDGFDEDELELMFDNSYAGITEGEYWFALRDANTMPEIIELLDAEPLYGRVDAYQIDLDEYEEAQTDPESQKYYAALKLPETTHDEKSEKLLQLAVLHHKRSRDVVEPKVQRVIDEGKLGEYLTSYILKAKYYAPDKPTPETSVHHSRSYYVYTDEDQSEYTDLSEMENRAEIFKLLADSDDVKERFEEKYYEAYDEDRENALVAYRANNIPDEDNPESVSYIKQRFERELSVDIEQFDRYHEYSKSADTWYVEPDGSIQPHGAELVSPAMPYQTALSMLGRVCDIIEYDSNMETNDSTGLHVNVGTFSKDEVGSIDLLKLLMFFGERHVSDIFGRTDNEYTQSHLKDIYHNVEMSAQALEKVNSYILRLTDRKMTINMTNLMNKGYFEIRVMGGRNYDSQVDTIKDTIGRFVRCLEIAMDPSAYRNEYLKKLSKFIQSDPDQPGVALSVRDEATDFFKEIQNRHYRPSTAVGFLVGLANTFKEYPMPAAVRTKARSVYLKFIKTYGVQGERNFTMDQFVKWIEEDYLKINTKASPQTAKFIKTLALIKA